MLNTHKVFKFNQYAREIFCRQHSTISPSKKIHETYSNSEYKNNFCKRQKSMTFKRQKNRQSLLKISI